MPNPHADAIARARDAVAWSDERLVTCGDLRALLAQLDALTADAERAEAERDEAKKDAAMWKDIADMNYRGFKREKAKIADAIIALSAGDGGGEP